MSPRKIIFLVIAGIALLSIIGTIVYMSTRASAPQVAPATMKIWITDGTTESYEPIIAGFKKYAPEYEETDIIVEKKTTDPIRYRTLLLSTLADGVGGPDIFSVRS
jgi:hypothetical protein